MRPAAFPFVPPSAIAGTVWPAIPAAPGAALLALQFQLEHTQWWPPERLARHQLAQLQQLLIYARDAVPLYHERFSSAGFDPRADFGYPDFVGIPLLTRADLQRPDNAANSTRVPESHGKVIAAQTSGSSGTPVRFNGTELTQFFWNVFTLREQLWHRRDFAAKYAVIRTLPGDALMPSWSPALDAAVATGPGAFLRIETDVARQIEWLRKQDPDYLLTYASNLGALARHCIEHRIALPRLREVGSIGEVVTPEIRADCRNAWSVKLVDIYSAQEVGYIALQCPEHEHYHVQSENVLVEVLDGEGRPCVPGEVGRVVVTAMHNFATPFIRYDIGDYAEVGAGCPCGRGLPVLNRVMGRRRNMLVLPNGERRWPVTGCREYADPWLLRQFQFVQKSLNDIEVRLATSRPLTAQEEAGLKELILGSLGHPFRLHFVYCERIERSPGGKYEDFKSEIA
ncbi:MAG: phenylacetate--CoA ligase family protein [Betaproteobacteria bacterium]|nr:phenylacetate--CoA ligase family protein [Betaproteobacteria bacterium]